MVCTSRQASVLLAASAVLVVNGCTRREEDAGPGGQRPVRVTATTGMIADAVRAVGGEHVRVTALMGPGVNPHLYKASAGDINRLVGADIVFYNGLHLEGELTGVLEALAKRKPALAVASGIDPRRLLQPPEFEGYHDPHIWFDLTLWMEAVEAVREGLKRIDPQRAVRYDGPAEKYLEALAELHRWALDRAAELPLDARVLVTSHDAYNYFGRAYGFEVIGVQGISTEEQATSRAIVELSRLIQARRIRAIFTESSISPKAIRAVIEDCRRSGWRVEEGGELFSDALGEPGTPGGTFIGMFRHNVDTIVDALKGLPVTASTLLTPAGLNDSRTGLKGNGPWSHLKGHEEAS